MPRETKSNGKKDELDKFYTKNDIVNFCLSKLNLSEFDCIIEPSAGDGAFSHKIQNCIAYDIEPGAADIIKQDWFLLDKNQFKNYQNILIIGNPPFGEQNSLAVRFFNESSFANMIAFILPRSFKKSSVQNRLNENFHLILEFDLSENAFTLNGENYSVPCTFQVWKRSEEKRIKIKMKMTSDLFEFVTFDECDIRIPRVGGNCGKATLKLDGAKTSNYFIKNKTQYTNEEFVNLINQIKFPSIEFTVGPKSLPKGELVLEIEDYLENLIK